MSDRRDPPAGSDPFDMYADLSALDEDTSLPQLEDPSTPQAIPPRSPLLTGLIVALLLIVVSIAIFQLLRDDEGDTVTGPTNPTSTSAGTTATTATTSEPTDTTEPTDPTDTTGPTTATTDPGDLPTGFDPYVASGDPVPFDDLRMAVDGIGPIDFGQPADEAVGRLIASLGSPDDDTGPVASTGKFGVCEGDTERIVRWGPFVAIVIVDDDGSETFGGYRLDFQYAVEGLGSPATELQTLSGLKAGQSVVALREIYETFEITFEVLDDLGTTFQLKSRSSGNLLLWGPVTSDDTNGIVLGIYAPDACGRF